MPMLRSIAPPLLAALALPSWAAAAPLYFITPLGTLGGNQSFALAVNNAGQVSGNASKTPGGNLPLNTALWSPGSYGGPANLGILPGADRDFSRGYAINDAGRVVGESSNETSRAFLFRDGALIDLGTLGGATAVAHGINNRDQVVGIASTGTQSNAFLWRDGVMTNLGTLGGTLSRAWAINDAGQVVGSSRLAGSPIVSHAFLWRDGVMTDLGSLGGADRFSEAFAINEAGQVVGRSTIDATGVQRATLWDGAGSPGGGTMTDLGTLADPASGAAYRFSRANDVNASGVAVGTASAFEGFSGRAFVWDETLGIRDLTGLLIGGAGWVLTSAQGINDHGQIVGFGTFGGQTRAFLLTPIPEPSSVAMAGVGLASAALLARRRPRGAGR